MNEVLVLVLGIVLGISGVGIIKLVLDVIKTSKRSKSNELDVEKLINRLDEVNEVLSMQIAELNNEIHEDMETTVENIHDELEDVNSKIDELFNRK